MRHAFTIMELMVSSVLIVIITLFLYGAIGSMTLSNQTLALHDDADKNRSKLYQLLYRDFLQSISMKTSSTKDKHYTVVDLQTSNSLYNIDMPYVSYFVHSNQKELLRLESSKPIVLPVKYEDRFDIAVDTVAAEITAFNVYQSRSNEGNSSSDENASSDVSVLLYLKTKKGSSPFLLELTI